MQSTTYPAPSRSAWAYAAGIVLTVVVPIWIISQATDVSPFTESWVITLASMEIAGFSLTVLLAQDEFKPFQMIFWAYYYVFLGAAPLVQLRLLVSPETTPSLDFGQASTASLLVLVSEIFFIAGVGLKSRSGSSESSGTRRRSLDSSKLNVALLLALAVSLAYISIIGFGTLFMPRDTHDLVVANKISDSNTRYLLGDFVSLGSLILVVASVQAIRSPKAGVKVSRLLAGALAVTLLLIVNPIDSPRYAFLTVALALLACLGMFRTLSRYKIIGASIVLGLLTVFPVLDLFRQNLNGSAKFTGVIEALTGGDYDSFGQVINTAWYVEKFGITWGNQLWGVIGFLVPRSIWADKPLDTGVMLAHAKHYHFSNLSCPLPAEIYINFGWIGLVLGMLVVGFFVSAADSRANVELKAGGSLAPTSMVLPFYMILMLRGSLLQSTATFVIMLLTWWLISGSINAKDPMRLKSAIQEQPRLHKSKI